MQARSLLRRRGTEDSEREAAAVAQVRAAAVAQAQQAQVLKEELAAAEARHAAAHEKWTSELARVRREKEAALAELRQVSAEREAELEGQLAAVEETFGERLARAEEQRAAVARRLGKTSKVRESQVSQLEAERDLLEQRADALENELCEALEEKRHTADRAEELTRRLGEAEARAAALEAQSEEDRAVTAAVARHGAPPGVGGGGRSLADADEELQLSESVLEALRAHLWQVERELVSAKLGHAQAEEDRAALKKHLRSSRARQLQLAQRMTELEVRLAKAYEEVASGEERIAEAFSGVIRDLESQLRAANRYRSAGSNDATGGAASER